jgi:PAS domain S-box-containing protein
MRIRTKKGKYTLYWGMMGLSFPILATAIICFERSLSPIEVHRQSDFLLWFVDFAPIALAYFGRSLGYKQDKIEELTNNQRLELDAAALICHTNHLGIITFVNRTFCDETGYSEDELIGQNASLLRSKEHNEKFWLEFWGTIKKEQTWKGEIKNLKKDGSEIWLETTILPRYTREKISYHSVQINITAKKLKEVQVLQTSKLATIGELASGVGHEINNPLAIVIGNLQLIKKLLAQKTLDKVGLNIALDAQTSATDRMKNTVNGLRVFARAANKTKKSLNAHELLKESMDLIRHSYFQEGVQLLDQCRAAKYYVAGDPGKFQQVIMNLVRYAKNATEGQHSRIVRSTTEIEFDNIIIKITDNGPKNYFSDQDINSIELTEGDEKSTGISIGMINSLIHEMKGTLDLSTNKNFGNTFTITLPLDSSSSANNIQNVQNRLPSKKDGSSSKIGAGLNIMIVDDEPELLAILKMELIDLGCTVNSFTSGIKALESAKKESYNLIFSDIRMPEMDGNELLNEFNKSGVRDKSTIIAVTGGVPGDIDFGNYDGYILKPFGTKALVVILQKYLSKKTSIAS